MSTITSFKDIKAWGKGIDLTKQIYLVSGKEPFSRDFPLKNQIRRAAISISSNIAEGFEREGKKEFIQYLTVAKGSTAEVQTQIAIAYELAYLSRDEYDQLDRLCSEIIFMISRFLRYLHNSPYEGFKFKGK
jgi:four helix bundle protein